MQLSYEQEFNLFENLRPEIFSMLESGEFLNLKICTKNERFFEGKCKECNSEIKEIEKWFLSSDICCECASKKAILMI